jgi:hypothetical protein
MAEATFAGQMEMDAFRIQKAQAGRDSNVTNRLDGTTRPRQLREALAQLAQGVGNGK